MTLLARFNEETSTDAGLVGACLRADDAAWERLVDRYAGLVYSVIRRYRLPEHDAMDVFQDVWVTAWEKLDTLRDQARLGPWLVTVAGRLAWDAAKRQPLGRVTQPLDAAVADTPDGSPGPDHLASEREMNEEIRAAIERLSPRCRALVLALFYDPTAPTYAEIAERVGCSPNSIGPIRGRCFDELRAALRGTLRWPT